MTWSTYINIYADVISPIQNPIKTDLMSETFMQTELSLRTQQEWCLKSIYVNELIRLSNSISMSQIENSQT